LLFFYVGKIIYMKAGLKICYVDWFMKLVEISSVSNWNDSLETFIALFHFKPIFKLHKLKY